MGRGMRKGFVIGVDGGKKILVFGDFRKYLGEI
jgi:hypothetical protein